MPPSTLTIDFGRPTYIIHSIAQGRENAGPEPMVLRQRRPRDSVLTILYSAAKNYI
jgi:hypothetical protein